MQVLIKSNTIEIEIDTLGDLRINGLVIDPPESVIGDIWPLLSEEGRLALAALLNHHENCRAFSRTDYGIN